MLKKAFYLLLVVTIATSSNAQKLEQSAWQQQVNHTIQVALNDSNNTLSGVQQVVYNNQSPDTLRELYFHLWPNAYLNNSTPFAKQQVENGQQDFYFSNDEDKGRIDSLSFKANNQKLVMQFVEGSFEICRITLPKPLLPGENITLTNSFRVKMPKVFSRMGHENNLYCVTQWFPKPAVYDVNGWNTMPYLDQGEFYSEFGNYDVSITSPKDYVVVATGNVQDTSEINWWRSRATSSNIPHPSESPTKTVRFLQSNVHDFAWFASKKFKALSSKVKLPSGAMVDTWLFADAPTLAGVNYINEAITFYSEKVGEYPYTIATVVKTPLKAGGGMEYPTITNVGEIGRQVIVHEVGHNWFYGILGSNERKYPWMDESINNYYEARSNYKKAIVTHGNLFNKGNSRKGFSFSLTNLFSSPFGMLESMYLLSARKNADQPAFMPADSFTSKNYGYIIYGKASLAFNQLQHYLGDDVFDAMMKSYYEKWKFKHPLPNDFINHVKSFTGKNLNWFFNDVMNGTGIQDFAIKKITVANDSVIVTIKNRGIQVPVSVQGISNGEVTTDFKLEPFAKSTQLIFSKKLTDTIIIDGYESSIDVYRNNNFASTKGIIKTLPKPQFKFLANVEKPEYAQVFYTPIIAANIHNKTMLGLAFYNSLLPRKKTEFWATPMYAFGTKDLAGNMSLQHRFFTPKIFKEVQLGIEASRFATSGYNSNQIIGYDTLATAIYGDAFGNRVYEKIAPRLTFIFANKYPRVQASHVVNIRYILTKEQKHTREVLRAFDKHNSYVDVKYLGKSASKINYSSWQVNYQYGNAESAFQKLSVEGSKFLSYGQKKQGLQARFFGGVFLQKPTEGKDAITHYRVADNNGQYDYLYDELQFGRGAQEINTNNMFTQQLMPGNSGFRAHASGLGQTDSWLVAANLTSTIPGILPLRIFIDAAAINSQVFSTNGNTGNVEVIYEANIHYTAGVNLYLFKDILEVNFPIFVDSKLKSLWSSSIPKYNYGQQITFTLRLNVLNPIKQIRENKLL